MVEAKHVARKTEVLYLTYDGLTDPLGQSQILPYLCGIADSGYSVTIVSFEKKVRFGATKNQISIICNAHKLDWVPLIYHKTPPILSTLFDLYRLRRYALKLHKRKNFSIVHCRSYITALLGLWLKNEYSIKFIFDMRGFWVDERVEGGLWNLKNPLYKSVYKFFKRKEKEFIHRADSVIVLTNAAEKELVNWNLNSSITIIPCCVDLKQFDPKRFNINDRNKLREELGIAVDDYILLYLGSLGTWYLYSDMVSYFQKLKKQKPNARFLFITQDIEKIEGNREFIARTVSRDEIPKYIFACDASICFIKPSFSKKGSSATKMAEVLAMGLPLVTNTGWGDVDFLKRHVNNLFVVDNNHQELINTDWSAQLHKGRTEFFIDYFSLETGIQKYCRVYDILKSETNPIEHYENKG